MKAVAIVGIAALVLLAAAAYAKADEPAQPTPAPPRRPRLRPAPAAPPASSATAAAVAPRPASAVAAKPKATAMTAPARSPVPEASGAAWGRFVQAMKSGRLGSVSAQGHLGLFQMGPQRLEDLGYVRNSRFEEKNGEKVWTGDWVAPHTREKFLGDAKLQYAAFVRSVVDHRKAILAKHADAIGRELGGKKATLSGLLAVAKQAGMQGLTSWLESGADATKYPRTSAAFANGNGIF